MRSIAAASIAIGLTVVAIGASAPTADARTVKGTLIKVVDGDTVQVKVGKQRRIVNLIGLKTPGRRSCAGERSRAFTARFLRPTTNILVRTRGSRKIGTRRVFRAEIYRRQGRRAISLNLALIRSGHARIRTSPGRRTSVAFRKGQKLAKQRRRGTWGNGCRTAAPRGPVGVPAGDPTPTPGARPGAPQAVRDITALLVDRQFTQSVTRREGESTIRDDTELNLCRDFSFELSEFLSTDDDLTNFETTTGQWSLSVAPDLSQAGITLEDDIDGEIIPIELGFATDAGGNRLVLFDGEVFTSQPATGC